MFKNNLKVLGLIFLSGCSSNYDSETQSRIEALVTLNASSRLIIEDKNINGVADEVKKNGGAIVREMESVKGLVAHVPSQALKGLQHKFPDAVITEDIEMSIVLPVEGLKAPSTRGKPGGTQPQPPEVVPWGISAIHADSAQAINRGLGVTVCVVDTGVDRTHPDLAANILGGRNLVSAQNTDPANYNDDNGHGSHVAGTIAAIDNTIGAIGVAPDAKIYAVKVLNRQGSGYLSDIADGVTECVRAGARVINMSLGGNSDPNLPSPFKTAINNAVAAGVVVVVAAGNEGQNISNTVPAGYSNVIAVSAIASNNTFPSFSNFGLGTKDFAAPGVSIFSTWKSGGYNTISGTSMASPHVAGVVALKISSGAANLVGVDLGATLSRQGSGRIDALLSVNSL